MKMSLRNGSNDRVRRRANNSRNSRQRSVAFTVAFTEILRYSLIEHIAVAVVKNNSPGNNSPKFLRKLNVVSRRLFAERRAYANIGTFSSID